MASRKEQKDAARQRRLEEERASAQKVQRTRRLQMVGGVVVAAIIVVVVLVIVSSGGGGSSKAAVTHPQSAAAKKTAAQVTNLLQGIPQHGNTLGNPNARVTMTEYGDLVCPVCRDFALGGESELIAKDVRQGKVKIVYRALETASETANNAMFVPSQMAARAAGAQDKGWNYIELFYHQQGDETSSYVTTSYLQGLAGQIPGLNVAKWNAARTDASYKNDVIADESAAQAAGFQSTPTMVFQGPVSQSKPAVGVLSYSQLESAIKSVA